MSDVIEPRLPKWPFYLGDVLLLGLAWLVYHKNQGTMGHWELALAVFCVLAGAGFVIAPFILEYRASVKLAEARGLATVVGQLENLEALAAQISHASGHWQDVHKHADKTAGSAREIAERIADEVRAFNEFMQRANEGEKGTLRLEVEKLRRAEADWLQVLVRILDHTFALHQGALRSGQQNLIGQLSNFQNACLDAARRVGLILVVAKSGEAFDAQRHQSIEDGVKPAADATISETVAPGFSFQGKLIRPVLVRLNGVIQGTAISAVGMSAGGSMPMDQNQLPLEEPNSQK